MLRIIREMLLLSIVIVAKPREQTRHQTTTTDKCKEKNFIWHCQRHFIDLHRSLTTHPLTPCPQSAFNGNVILLRLVFHQIWALSIHTHLLVKKTRFDKALRRQIA